LYSAFKAAGNGLHKSNSEVQIPLISGIELKDEIRSVIDVSGLPRTAAITCDIEPDYGGRTKTRELLDDRSYLDSLAAHCQMLEVPLSVFIVTNLLKTNSQFLGAVRDHDLDVHAHSHNHSILHYATNSASEIRAASEAFRKYFGREPLGYRAPQGLIVPGDWEVMADCGFTFSASVFPVHRPRLFDYRSLPQDPWKWAGGVVELPFASTQKGRRILSVSYLKLLGRIYWKRVLARQENMPRILIIDSHLHDFYVAESFRDLPLHYRLAWGRNRHQGFTHLSWLVQTLRRHGYTFVSMREVCEMVSGAG